MGLSKLQNLEHKYGTTKTPFLRKEMGHNFPWKEGIYHQRISIVKPNALLRGHEKTPTILNP
jgi:hypothetical protein